MTEWRMRKTCWVPKATHTLLENVMFIAFPLQQWLEERALMLRYTYINCLVNNRILAAACFWASEENVGAS
jgi:hypothetical protein